VKLPLLAAALLLPIVAAAQQSPPTFDALVSQASAARDQNDLPRAVALYRQALAVNPQWPDGWWYLGMLGYSASDYASATDALNHYLQLMPSAGPAFALRGLSEFEAADYPASLADIEHAISLGAANDQRNAQILRYHEAMLLTRASRFEEAWSAYTALAKDAPANPDLLTAMGLAGLRIPVLPSEAPAAQQEIAAAAGEAAWSFLSGDQEGAAQGFAALFSRYPAARNAHLFYGYLLFGHDPAAAIGQLQQELHLDADNVAALSLIAWGHILNNDPAAALPFARKAESLDSAAFMPQLVLGRSLVGTGDIGGGIQHLVQARQIDPGNLEVHIGLAIAYSRSGEPRRARAERLQSLALAAKDPVLGER
jgi:tetratricopeptide (TPR) repeat protein